MHECVKAEYIEKLPKGKHSTKGIGRTYPDPAKAKVIEDGVEVPLGPPVEDSKVNSALLYNEYPFLSTHYIFRSNFHINTLIFIKIFANYT